MASTSSWEQAGHRLAGAPSAMAAAHCAQVGKPQPPRPAQSWPGKMVRMSAASWLDDIQIHFLLLSLTLMEFLVAMGNRIHGHYVPLQAECQPKATNFLVFYSETPKICLSPFVCF